MEVLFAAHPEVFDKVGKVIIDVKEPKLGENGSVDMVLVFRSLHGWVEGGSADKFLSAIFNVLKPGGTFGIEGHRGNPGTPPGGGYLPEQTAIDLIKAAGFELAEKSEINANSADTKDHPKGVWSLPPTLAGGDQDQDKFTKIGESDRFTLRFVKPKN
jgi:predicted methyltransferase